MKVTVQNTKEGVYIETKAERLSLNIPAGFTGSITAWRATTWESIKHLLKFIYKSR